MGEPVRRKSVGDAERGEAGNDGGGLDVGLVVRFKIGFGTKFGSGRRCGRFKTLAASPCSVWM